MMELGNDVVNSIYEANYVDYSNEPSLSDASKVESHGIQIRRATSDCDNSIREIWIKAKYIDKAFVTPCEKLRNAEGSSLQKNIALNGIVFEESTWFVRSPRRSKIKIQIEKTEKRSTTVDDSASGSEVSTDSNQAYDELGFDSDNDSMDDDEHSEHGLTKEKYENFNSDMLLYNATIVHNLPVMCYALASGASKIWSNPMDLHRSPLHQAVLSVNLLLKEMDNKFSLYLSVFFVCSTRIWHTVCKKKYIFTLFFRFFSKLVNNTTL